MNSVFDPANGGKKFRLQSRLEEIARKQKISHDSEHGVRQILITTGNRVSSYEFEEIPKVINSHSFFLGYKQFEQVNFISSIVLSVPEEMKSTVSKKLSSYRHITYSSSSNNEVCFLVPLCSDIKDESIAHRLSEALSYELDIKVNISLNDSFVRPKIGSCIVCCNETSSYLNVKSNISKYERLQIYKKTLKKRRKIEQINRELYRVKRLNTDGAYNQNEESVISGLMRSTEKLKAPYTLKEVKEYSSKIEVSCILAISLGINKSAVKDVMKGKRCRTSFPCILQEKGEAILYINNNIRSHFYGQLTYKSLVTQRRYSMGELYATLLSPNEAVNKPTLMALQLKLLDEAGLIQVPEVEVKTPKNLTNAQLKVYEGFKQLLKLKQAVVGQSDDPILFTYSFAKMWCDVSRITATAAIKSFVKENVIYVANEGEKLKQYLFCTVKSLTEVVKEQLEQTSAVRQVIYSSFRPNELKRSLKPKKPRVVGTIMKNFFANKVLVKQQE